LSLRYWARITLVKGILGIWLALLASAAGLSMDAGEAALRYLEKIRDGKVNLEPGRDTALANETTRDKRLEIARRLARVAQDLVGDSLELGEVKVDGNYAAALVRITGGFDPARMRVMAVALVRRDGQWRAAPVPASFENTGTLYAPGASRKIRALQDWMLREQALDLERLRDESADRMRREIARTLPAETLRSMTAREVGERFMDACMRRNLHEVLGFLGGLSQPPPDDWALRLSTAQAALSGEPVSRAWRLLISQDVLRAQLRLEADDSEASLSIGCLDPTGRKSGRSQMTRAELVHLPMRKSPDRMWRIDPSPEFYLTDEEGGMDSDESMDSGLLDVFAVRLAEMYPPQAEPDALTALRALLKSLNERDLHALMRLLPPAESPARAREAYKRAAHVWWTFCNPAEPLHTLVPAIHTDNSAGAAVCQVFSPRNPDRLELRFFYFEKTDAGWFWTPAPDAELEQSMREWTRDQSADRQESWQQRLLADCVVLESLPESGVPDEADARRVVEEWLAATLAGDVESALRLTARLDKPDSAETVLRNLGYEITGIRKCGQDPQILHLQRAGIWTTVGVRIQPEDNPVFPLYPVIQTADGPRILLEVDLFATKNRSREFLNRTALSRLDGEPANAAQELRELLRKHQEIVDQAGPESGAE